MRMTGNGWAWHSVAFSFILALISLEAAATATALVKAKWRIIWQRFAASFDSARLWPLQICNFAVL